MCSSDLYVDPTLFTRVDNRMTIAREEIFGPVAALIEVDGLEHALQVANDTIYGLAASVWTSNLKAAHEAVRGLEAGTICVNCHDHGDPTSPFLGYKQSGQGGIESFLHEYKLSSKEGIVLMCLAEALLRIPDADQKVAERKRFLDEMRKVAKLIAA